MAPTPSTSSSGASPTAVMAGAEAISVPGGPAGALLLHGFTGTPYAMRRAAERLGAAGFAVEVPRLPGHGTALEDLVPMRWADWAAAADESYGALAEGCEATVVVGHSMGGTLACLLAERHPEIRAVAVVNPFVEPLSLELRAAVGRLLEAGTAVLPGAGPDVADPDAAGYPTYDGTPLAALLSLCDGVEEVAAALAEVRCPVLVCSSRQDHVVAPRNGDFLEAAVSGPCTRVWLERSYHAAMVDYDHAEIEARVAAFALEHAGDALVHPAGAGA